ncbi:MAG: RusA family crossover junction endodeoxyribonuclease [Longimicrobiaceae bacterium]
MITFEVAVAPVSFQATSTRKAAILSAVRAIVSQCHYLLGGDLKLVIKWGISERARYESDSAADVDNIVKPILDALSGPEGIMIDDCQVQELICYWSGGYDHPVQQHIAIEVGFDPDAWFSKTGLIFLEIDRGLYLPMDGELPTSIVLDQAQHFIERFEAARRMIGSGASPYQAHLTLPIQRVFHRSKIGTFRITTLEELRNSSSKED